MLSALTGTHDDRARTCPLKKTPRKHSDLLGSLLMHDFTNSRSTKRNACVSSITLSRHHVG